MLFDKEIKKEIEFHENRLIELENDKTISEKDKKELMKLNRIAIIRHKKQLKESE